MPLLLLIVAALALIAKIGYSRYVRRTRGPGKPDATEGWLWWGAFLSIAAVVIWTLVAFNHRDTEQVKSGPASLSEFGTSNDAMWYSFVAAVFGLGCVFVVLMYIKDSKSIRWFWAAKLAILRITVYAILCFVFLLPAKQTWERTEKKSRVVVVLDISPSMTRVSDEVDSRGRQAKTRMDILLDFLTDEKNDNKVRFIQKILEKNPIVVYSFGTRLDDNAQMINRDEKAWDRSEWESFISYDFRPAMLKGLTEDGKQKLRASTQPVPWSGPPLAKDQKKLEPTNWADWAAMWVGHARQLEQANAKETVAGNRKRLVDQLSEDDDATLLDNIKKTRPARRCRAHNRTRHQRPRFGDRRRQSRVAEHGSGHRGVLGWPQQSRFGLFLSRTARSGDERKDPGLHGRGRRRPADDEHQHQRNPGR